MHRIGFIGCGKMAYALAKSIEKSALASAIFMSDKNNDRLNIVAKMPLVKTTLDNLEVVNNSDVVFLAIKPNNLNSVLDEIKYSINNQIIVSIVAGKNIGYIESVIGNKKIVRVMPNISCLVGEMAAAYSFNKEIDEQDINIIQGLLNSAGIAFNVAEQELDVVTALSGSGPGFFARIVSDILKVADKNNFDLEIAKKLLSKTLIGTGKLLIDYESEEIVKMVASPAGTTESGLKEIKNIDKVIEKTINKSKELGKHE